ncbi:MAG: hypothetical protein AB7O26_14885 [Planctomycetaceae bacterium]
MSTLVKTHGSVSLLAAALTLFFGTLNAVRADEGHAHPEKGPRGGALVELGEEEFHAEVLHDHDSHTVTIFLLDGSARRPVGIDSREVLVNIRIGRKAKQFKVAAAPQKGDRAGYSTRFAARSEELCHMLDEHEADARLNVRIAGRGYSGKIPHVHDHDHDHEHDHKH